MTTRRWLASRDPLAAVASTSRSRGFSGDDLPRVVPGSEKRSPLTLAAGTAGDTWNRPLGAALGVLVAAHNLKAIAIEQPYTAFDGRFLI